MLISIEPHILKIYSKVDLVNGVCEPPFRD